jgi:hypothetical protein
MAHDSIVTIALPLTEILEGIRWVTPSPAQVSLVEISAECVTMVPLG